jgi:hypothetical protein
VYISPSNDNHKPRTPASNSQKRKKNSKANNNTNVKELTIHRTAPDPDAKRKTQNSPDSSFCPSTNRQQLRPALMQDSMEQQQQQRNTAQGFLSF